MTTYSTPASGPIERLLLRIAGSDPNVLEHAGTHGERTRQAGLGGIILATALLATASFAYATHVAFQLPAWQAIPAGAIWGVIILNLDRWFVSSHRWNPERHQGFLHSAPRLILALLIGAVIAEPIVLRAFQDEIRVRATANKQATYTTAHEQLLMSFADLKTLQNAKATLEARLTVPAGTALLSNSPDYQAKLAQLQAARRRADAAQHAAICEYDGTCGTRKRGDGPLYIIKKQRADQLAETADRLQQELDSLARELQASASTTTQQQHAIDNRNLGTIIPRLNARQAELDRQDSELVAALHAPIGLLDRTEALHDLTFTHPDLLATYLIIFLFLVALDTAPVLAKTLLSRNPTLYDRTQHELERHIHKRSRHTLRTDTALHRETENERRRLISQAENELLTELVAEVAAIAREEIDDYLEQERERLRNAIHITATSGRNGP